MKVLRMTTMIVVLVALLGCLVPQALAIPVQYQYNAGAGGFHTTGDFTGTLTNSVASGGKGANLQPTQLSTVALTGTLVGYYGRVTAGDTGGAGTARGCEIGARVTDVAGKVLSVVTGGYFWADAKTRTATTLRGLEVSLDGGAGGTSTLAEGLVIFNNSSATQTTSVGVDINGGTPSGHKAFTYDFRGQNGETITNATDGVVGISPASVQVNSMPVVLNTRHRVTVAEINEGHEILPAITGRTYRMISCKAIAYGGAVGATTTVDLLGTQSAAPVKLVAYAQANLTQSTVLVDGATGAAVLADGASYVACDANTAITVGKTGNAADTATGVDLVLSYVIE